MSSLRFTAGSVKIALIHDWILGLGGAERVLKVFHEMFPEAPIYTLFYHPQFTDSFLPQARIVPSNLQKLYRSTGRYRWLLPFLPSAVESWNFSEFDLVISSNIAFSKGLVLKPKTRHFCYCYSPTRWLWDRASNNRGWSKIFAHFLRIWDRQASLRVDQFAAISKNVRARISRYYGREAEVIYPPLTLTETSWPIMEKDEFLKTHHLPADYFLIVSRLFIHKNIDLAIEAFNKLHWPLVVVGEGPQRKKLQRKIVDHTLIKMVDYQPDDKLASFYRHSRAFIMPQEEDFGLTPLESMFYGRPVLALRQGGALEYVLEGINGEFFDEPYSAVLADGARRLNENFPKYSPVLIKKTAERFSRQRFEEEIQKVITKILNPA